MKIVRFLKERREKLGDQYFSNDEQHNQHSNEGHGFDASSHNKHDIMAEAMKGCSIVLAHVMGAGAYQCMLRLNIKSIVTDIKTID